MFIRWKYALRLKNSWTQAHLLTYSPILRNQFLICRCMKLLEIFHIIVALKKRWKRYQRKSPHYATSRIASAPPGAQSRASDVQNCRLINFLRRVFFNVQVLNVRVFLNVQVQKIDQFPSKRSVRGFLCHRPQAAAGWSLGYWQIVSSRGPPTSHHP